MPETFLKHLERSFIGDLEDVKPPLKEMGVEPVEASTGCDELDLVNQARWGRHYLIGNIVPEENYRALNEMAVKKKMEKSGPGVQRYEDDLLQYIANGWKVVPRNVSPKVALAQPESEAPRHNQGAETKKVTQPYLTEH